MSDLRERIDHVMAEKEWLDERVSSVFLKYCQTFGVHKAYGVDSWEIWGDKLEVTQDITCRGCYDVERHSLPIEYLYSDDYESVIERDFQDQQRKKEEKRERQRFLKIQRREEEARQQEEKDKAEYERLKTKFEKEN